MGRMRKKMKNSKKYFLMFTAVVWFLVVFLFFAACGIYFFERAEQPEMFDSIPKAFAYVFLTMFTIGYSEVYPITFGGKFISIVVIAVGSLISLACFIGMIWGTLKLGTVLRRIRVKKSKIY